MNDNIVLTFPPGNGVSLRRKCLVGRKMSRKAPQNREKTKPQGAEGAQMQQKTPSLGWEGVFYLNGSDELTAEVVEQDVL